MAVSFARAAVWLLQALLAFQLLKFLRKSMPSYIRTMFIAM